MDVRYLNYVIEISNRKSITKAATALHVSQSTLSQFLTKLENELGEKLFDRMKSGLSTTHAGELYVQAAKSVIQIQKHLYRNIRSIRRSDNIRIGTTTQWAIDMLTNMLPNLINMIPSIRIEIIEGRFMQIKQLLTDNKINMALLALSDPDDFDEHIELLAREEIMLCISSSHHYALSHPNNMHITSQDFVKVFAPEQFIMSASGSILRQLSDRFFQNNFFTPKTICEMNNNIATQRMVAAGAGVSFMPISYRDNTPGLQYFSFSPPLYRYNALCYSKNMPLGEAELYITQLIYKSKIFSEVN